MAGPLSGRAGTLHGKVAESVTPGGESGVHGSGWERCWRPSCRTDWG